MNSCFLFLFYWRLTGNSTTSLYSPAFDWFNFYHGFGFGNQSFISVLTRMFRSELTICSIFINQIVVHSISILCHSSATHEYHWYCRNADWYVSFFMLFSILSIKHFTLLLSNLCWFRVVWLSWLQPANMHLYFLGSHFIWEIIHAILEIENMPENKYDKTSL